MNRGGRISIKTDRFNSFVSSKVKQEKPFTKLYLKRFHLHKENKGDDSRWKFFYDRIVDFLRIIEICKICKTQNCLEIIYFFKLDIIMCFKNILAENKDHKRWPDSNDADAQGEVVVANIFCSVCEGDYNDGDIILCDSEGCNRAYRKGCLG